MSAEKVPQQPDVLGIHAEERGFGGKWKKRVFARLVWQGMDPYEAFIKADYPVMGVNSTIGHRPWEAKKRAEEMAASGWCRDWALSWTIDPKDQVKASVPEAIAVLVDGLKDRRDDGRISSLAVRCAENLLDRGGIVRSQVIETPSGGDGESTRDAKELIRLIKERLEALEGPVRQPPALEKLQPSVIIETSAVPAKDPDDGSA